MSEDMLKCRVWGFHSDGYEDLYLLGYNAMYPIESQQNTWYCIQTVELFMYYNDH
jgi:hypothetical protein